MTRWVGLLSTGAMLGILLSGVEVLYGGYTYWRDSKETMQALAIAITLCELPANTLLYFHLRNMARQIGDRRIAAQFEWCVWIVPAVTAGACAILSMHLFLPQSEWPRVFRLGLAGYGALAVAGGAAATAAVCRLMTVTAAVAYGGWLAEARRTARRFPALLRRVLPKVERDAGRWAVIAGLILWLALVPSLIDFAIAGRTRTGLMGMVPIFNFPGPKVFVAPMAWTVASEYGYEYARHTDLAWAQMLNVLAVWLMTHSYTGDGAGKWLRRLARWGTTLAVGATIGVALTYHAREESVRRSHVVAFCVTMVEAPMTLLLYLHLARLAAAAAEPVLARTIRWLAIAAAALSLAPLSALVVSSSMRPWRNSPVVAGVASLYVAAVFAVGLMVALAVAKLAWRIARPRITSSPIYRQCPAASP